MATETKDKKDKKEEAGSAKAEPKKGSNLKWIIISVAGAALIGGGGFFGWTLLSSRQHEAPKVEAPVPPVQKGKIETVQANSGFIYALDPFIVNLADTPEIRYLKVTIKLDLENEELSKELEGHLAQIRDTLLILLSSKDYEGIRSIEGKFRLREEIVERANNIVKKGKVKTAYFTEFVVQ
ncbi:MAG TPA: flagellar basal body-associated FliL family protein [Nitrospiria bacterium]|nr:flagellar basal body-associated FliL family protein [Nitrospiria bacterium]